MSRSGLFQLDVARSLARQLTVAVGHVHQQGYVHGGQFLPRLPSWAATLTSSADLHLGNVLLRLAAGFDQLSEAQVYEKFGSPICEPVRSLGGIPPPPVVRSQVVLPAWLGTKSEDIKISEAQIILSDFSVSFNPSKESRFESFAPLEIRPPEARFEPSRPLSFASDIWSLGCTIWAILWQRSFLDSFLFSEDGATSDQVDALGPLPPEWWDKWTARTARFEANGVPREGRSPWTWDQRFEDSIQEPRRERNMPTVCEAEKADLFAMIRSMLAFRPEGRPSARQVLESPWMRNWAAPAGVVGQS